MIALKIKSKKQKSKIILPKLIYATPMFKIKKITINSTFMIKISIVFLKKTILKLLFDISKHQKSSYKITTKSIATANPNLTRYWNKQATFSFKY